MVGKTRNSFLDLFLTLLLCALCIGTTFRYTSIAIEILLVLSMGVAYFFASKDSHQLERNEKRLILAFCCFFLSALLTYLIGAGWELKSIRNPSMPSLVDLDLPSKYLLGALLFFLMLRIDFRICKRAFLYAIGAGGIINGCVGIYERYILDTSRVHGWGGIAEMADASALLGIFSAILFVFASSKKERAFYLIAVFMGCFASILTGTRGAMLGIALAFIFIGMIVFFKKRASIGSFVLAMLVGFSGFGVDYLTSSRGVQDRIKVASEDLTLYQEGQVYTSLGMRFEMWKEAVAMFQMAPVFGLSTAEIATRMPEILEKSGSQLEKSNHPQNDARGNKHNQLLNQAAKRGIVGVLAILFVWFACVKLFLRNESLMGNMLGLSIVVYFIPPSLTGEPWESNVTFPLLSIWICAFYKLMRSGDLSAH